jgi:hypothetical protein
VVLPNPTGTCPSKLFAGGSVCWHGHTDGSVCHASMKVSFAVGRAVSLSTVHGCFGDMVCLSVILSSSSMDMNTTP